MGTWYKGEGGFCVAELGIMPRIGYYERPRAVNRNKKTAELLLEKKWFCVYNRRKYRECGGTKVKEDRQIVRDTWNMAWPAILESFFSAFAGLVDSFMVSTMGAYSVAAVGLTTQPKFIGLALFFATNVAVSALVARRKGEGKRRDANSLALTSVCFVAVMAVVISILMVTLADPILRFCGSTVETHASAVAYFQIIMGGMIFNCLQMVINAAQRGAGNTKITMRTNVTSNVINIIFNYLLIGGHLGFPALGIHGAALATVLGTVVACVMSVLSIYKKDNFISIPLMLEEKIRPGLASLRRLLGVGYSVFFEQILMRVGFMMTSLMAAHQGNDAMAAHQVAMNIMGLSFSFGDGLQSAAVALIGRSLGENDPELAKRYGSTCRKVGAIISAILSVLYFFGARPLYSLFFAERQIVDIGVGIMRVIIFIVILQISQVIYMGCLRGAGDTLYTAVASTISVTVMRTLVSWLGCYVFGLGIIGIWLGVVADQLSRFLFASIRFRMGKWTQIKI